MSVVDLSSRDPIFFLHHANIDRLWATWNARGNANSPEAMWRDFAFNRNFIHPDGSPWSVAVGDLTPAGLGYRYDDEEGPFAADLVQASGDDLMVEKLRAYRRLDPGELALARGGLRRIDLNAGGVIHAAAADNELSASRDRPIGISVPLGRPLGEIVEPMAFAMHPDAKKYRRYVWAVLRDIEQPLDVTTRVRVFTNCHDLSASTRLDHPSYTTSLSFFGSEHAEHLGAAEKIAAGTSV
ncbi:MAG: tyrosinase family protein [Hyphomicrobiales bacterium]